MNQGNLFKEYRGVFSENEAEEKEEPKEKSGLPYAYSPFALQDAIGARDVKKTWLEYQKLILSGIEAEELVHKVISKVRDMSAISKGASATSLGIKEYPYTKSKKDLKNWKPENLQNFYEKIVSIYHLSRLGGENLETALEKALLTI